MAAVVIHDFTAIGDYTHPIIPVKDRDWMILLRAPREAVNIYFCSWRGFVWRLWNFGISIDGLSSLLSIVRAVCWISRLIVQFALL